LLIINLLKIEEKHKNDKYDLTTVPISGVVNVSFIDGATFNIANNSGNEL